MTGVEIDFVVDDSLAAFETYRTVFGAVALEKTAYEKGLNEVVFTIFDSRFHMLDENPEYQLFAPGKGQCSVWFNLVVEDIQAVYDRAAAAGFAEIQPVTEYQELGMRNAMQKDPFGYIWMLHQIDKAASPGERHSLMEAECQCNM